MPTPSTEQTQMSTFMGRAPSLDANGQIDNIAFKVNVISKAANYTVKATESGSIFIATAAVVFTLPAPADGLTYTFINAADANMQISANADDKMITFNDVDADYIIFSTAGNKIGAMALVVSDGTMWYANGIGANTMTVDT